uniref:MYND-type domain-containing protein n=1 Tax=Chlamydomonas leiostraca TaxID=1034604 RepID=A0A7S0X3B3_9CHLO|mmetsp:Transcript_9852/g.24595  ORF Transcript_9852/g.24595 Transcript_9852/m.24595 type:complete len:419 (+) Transcript_9852:73-1329(+)
MGNVPSQIPHIINTSAGEADAAIDHALTDAKCTSCSFRAPKNGTSADCDMYLSSIQEQAAAAAANVVHWTTDPDMLKAYARALGDDDVPLAFLALQGPHKIEWSPPISSLQHFATCLRWRAAVNAAQTEREQRRARKGARQAGVELDDWHTRPQIAELRTIVQSELTALGLGTAEFEVVDPGSKVRGQPDPAMAHMKVQLVSMQAVKEGRGTVFFTFDPVAIKSYLQWPSNVDRDAPMVLCFRGDDYYHFPNMKASEGLGNLRRIMAPGYEPPTTCIACSRSIVSEGADGAVCDACGSLICKTCLFAKLEEAAQAQKAGMAGAAPFLVEARCPKEGCDQVLMKAAGLPDPNNPDAPSGCSYCGGPGEPSLKQCSKCHVAKYCCKECQADHWPVHKTVCKLLKRAPGEVGITTISSSAT